MQRISNVSLNPEYNLLASSTEHFRRGDGGRRQVPLALLNTRFGRTQEVWPQPSKQRLRDTSFARQIASSPPAPISAGQDPSNITNSAHISIAQGFPAQLTQPPNKQSNDESDEEFNLIYEWYTNPALTTNHFSKLRELLPITGGRSIRSQPASKPATKFFRKNEPSQREFKESYELRQESCNGKPSLNPERSPKREARGELGQ